jgi:hypothetical protein
MKKYKIICRETGDLISEHETIEIAKAELESYELSDIIQNIYVDNFYEIKEFSYNTIIT